MYVIYTVADNTADRASHCLPSGIAAEPVAYSEYAAEKQGGYVVT